MYEPGVHDVRAALETAQTALREGRFGAALDALRGCEDWPIEIAERAVLLKAEALMRRDDDVGASAWLAATHDIVATDATRFERELLTGRIMGNVRNFAGAEARFARARRLLDRVPDGAPRLAFQTARLHWFNRTAKPDDPDVTLALTESDPTWRANAYSLRSWTYASQGRYREQVDDLRTAVEIFAAADYRCDVATMGTIVHSLARLSFEIADADALNVARAAFEAIRWTDEVRVEKFQSLRAFGLDAFMRGDAARAQWLFRDASAAATTPAYQAIAHLDRAYTARIARNEAWALDEIHEARRLAHGVAWGETYGEERYALLLLAVLLAPTSAADAQLYASMYSMLGVQSVSPTLALSQDRRAVAFEMFAQGRIEQTLGDVEQAQVTLREAYEAFAPIEHHYQAMLVASTLAELTGDTQWAERAKMHASRYPGCPIGDTPTATIVRSDSAFDELTPIQRQIARAVWSGSDVPAISAQFSRSKYTIERLIAEIYRAFDVSSPAELRAAAIQRGLA